MEVLDSLKEIGKQMNGQNNRLTQYPLFVIQVDKEVCVGRDGEWTHKERRDLDCIDPEVDLCTDCFDKYAAGEILSDDCEDCFDEAFDFYRIEEDFDLRAGVFFTAEACEKHIQLNHYHYNHPRSYCIGAWRNPEMQIVMQYLSGLGGEVAPFYK